MSPEEFLGDPIGDPIVLMDYDEDWSRRFEKIARRLRGALDTTARRIDHIGSTAVPELPAKPVIDVQVSVSELDEESAYRSAIESLGWPLRIRLPERRFFRPPRGRPRVTHIHVVEHGGEEERRGLLFVAYLRAHPGKRDAYAALKRDLASRFERRRADYLEGKSAFVAETLRLAEQWAEESNWRPD